MLFFAAAAAALASFSSSDRRVTVCVSMHFECILPHTHTHTHPKMQTTYPFQFLKFGGSEHLHD